MITPRIPQGGRWPEMKAAMRQIADNQVGQTVQPGFGTQIVEQSPAGTIIKAKPGEEAEAGDEPVWL